MNKIPSERTDKYFIYSFQCNNRAKLRVDSLAQMLQESAWLHAESCNAGFHAMKKEGLVWVLSGLKINIPDTPSWGDNVILKTWGRKYKGLMAYRDFEIYDENNVNLKVQASSSWLLIDYDTRRPKRITPGLQRIIPVDKSWTDLEPGDIKLPSAFESERKLMVLYSDLDIYNHVNNTRYIQWCIDSLSDFHKGDREIKSLDIRFIKETHLDERVKIEYTLEENKYFLRGINENTEKEIFRTMIS